MEPLTEIRARPFKRSLCMKARLELQDSHSNVPTHIGITYICRHNKLSSPNNSTQETMSFYFFTQYNQQISS